MECEVEYWWPLVTLYQVKNSARELDGESKRLLEIWMARYMYGVNFRERIWDKLHADIRRRHFLFIWAFRICLAIKWAWPVLILSIVAALNPTSAFYLAIVGLPLQALLLVIGAFKLYDIVIIISAYLIEQELRDKQANEES